MKHIISNFQLILLSAILFAGCSFSISSQPDNYFSKQFVEETESAEDCPGLVNEQVEQYEWRIKIDFGEANIAENEGQSEFEISNNPIFEIT